MRILDTHTGQFKDIDPNNGGIKYAILSHTWDRTGEQTYRKLRKIQKRYAPDDDSSSDEDNSSPHQSRVRAHPPSTSNKPPLSPIWNDQKLSPKIREACRVARENGYRYLWIDSCCIDKTSSSELSESINSMYLWYTLAHVCYAFLPDVPAKEDHVSAGSCFRKSRWFTRGWTLQELIAPVDVRFLSMEWMFIGSKDSLADLVVDITKIQHDALLNLGSLDEFSIAQRLSWAAERQTTRVEDRAYSLLGIFDINMPTLYGEGWRALRRLQEEIMRRTPDQSLFAWMWSGPLDPSYLPLGPHITDPDEGKKVSVLSLGSSGGTFLTSDLWRFRYCTDVRAVSHDEVARQLQLRPGELTTDYAFTPYGIRTQLAVISISDYFTHCQPVHIHDAIPLSQWYLVILACMHKNFPRHLLAHVCYIRTSESSIEFLHCGHIKHGSVFSSILPLSPAAITHFRSSGGQISIKTLYIPQPAAERDQGARDVARSKWHKTIKLVLPEKTREALSAQGYTATLRSPDGAHPRTHLVTLSRDTHTIFIDYKHTLEDDPDYDQKLTIEAHVKMSGPVLRGGSRGDPRDLQADDLDSVSRRDRTPWLEELRFDDVELNIPGEPTALTVRLSMTFAKTNYYVLDIELKTPGDPILADAPVAEIQDTMDGQPGS